ncbi:MFS monocarboxylate transporter-like protein [Peniophora sp. CONT]|nr:MFS monocarboxylate transporter-like protein [Peniophora sp. CONT]
MHVFSTDDHLASARVVLCLSRLPCSFLRSLFVTFHESIGARSYDTPIDMPVEPHSTVVSRSPTLRADELEVEKLEGPATDAPDDLAKKEDVSVFEQTLTPPTAQTYSDFPDGGLQAWLQVAGSFFLIFGAWGNFNAFGAFQTYYEEQLLLGTSASAISWIGSIEGFMIMIVGVLVGPVFDMGYFTSLVAVGSFMIVFGLMMTSLATSYYQVILAQGICLGMGSGLLFIPSVAIVATYFERKRALAVGISVCGSSVGGIIYPAIFRQLQPQIGFAWTVRTMAFITLGLLSFSLAVMRTRTVPRTRRALLDLSAFTEVPYVLFCIGNFLSFMGAYVPFFYGPAYTQAHTGASTSFAFYTIAILNGASTLGRVVPNFIADKTGPLNILTPCAFLTAILAFCWIPVDAVGSMGVWCALYGLASGALLSLAPAAIASLTADVGRVGTRLGMAFGIAGVGLLIGTPVAGALVDLETGDFVRAQVFNGAIVLGAAFFMSLSRVAKAGWSLRVKV